MTYEKKNFPWFESTCFIQGDKDPSKSLLHTRKGMTKVCASFPIRRIFKTTNDRKFSVLSLQITFFNLPMMLYLGNRSATTKMRPTCYGATGKVRLTVWTVLCHVTLVIPLLFHLRVTYTIYVCYGRMALILCPAGTWVILFGIWLMFRMKKFRKSPLS